MPASGTVKFDEGTDTDVLLGGRGRQWRNVEEISSFAALFEVPAGNTSPATVLASDAYVPEILTATGVRPRPSSSNGGAFSTSAGGAPRPGLLPVAAAGPRDTALVRSADAQQLFLP